MRKITKVSLWVVGIALIAAGAGFYILHRMRNPLTIMGAVTIQDSDSRKELPIADVQVSVSGGGAEAPAKSDASGYFVLHLHRWLRRGRPIVLQFRHPNYQPLDLKEIAQNKLYVARMMPRVKKANSNVPTVPIGNVRLRYSIKAPRTVNVGSAAQAFEVKNVGNVACDHHAPCSPDGKWKATIGSLTLDAGTGNEFLNARVSCIAGPCPFTRIESEGISNPAQKITATARNWSDTATFLVEAEVIHVMQSAIDHQSYPVIFGSALNFTLPKNAEGVSFEADMGGDTIIFPLGPGLVLSWASCNARTDGEGTIYRCELKPGYRFQ